MKLSLYKAEGALALYPLTRAFPASGKPMEKYLPLHVEYWVWVKKSYITAFWNQDIHRRIAKAFFKKSRNGFPKSWMAKWHSIDRQVTALSGHIYRARLHALGDAELYKLYQNLFRLDSEMWAISLFIDSLDPGFDQDEVQKISAKYQLGKEEISTLLAPRTPSYATEFERLLHDVRIKKISPTKVKKKFFWIGTEYATFQEVNDSFIIKMAKKSHSSLFVDPSVSQQSILHTHHLAKNPFALFQTLALWRDDRKRLNYTGLYGLTMILREIARRKGIPPDLSWGLLPQQVEAFWKGKISQATLRRQITEGVYAKMPKSGRLTYSFSKKGASLWQKILRSFVQKETGLLYGMAACRGKVHGRVKIIQDAYDRSDREKMRRGDILVTSMTRPEFLPLMRLAAGIITDEGGISSHAAIVSRELNIPSVIGTQTATRILKDGDLVELNANHGVVKILKRR